MGTKLSILLVVVFTLNVVKWFLPNGKTPFLCIFLPAKALSTILNGILLCLQIFFRPVGALVMSFPIYRWARQIQNPPGLNTRSISIKYTLSAQDPIEVVLSYREQRCLEIAAA
jgi:hypothetical protein